MVPQICAMLHKIKHYLAMISLQFGYAGMYVITMLCLKKGMNHYVLAVYRHLVATIVISPFAFVLERKIRPKMTFPILARILLLGFLEPVLDQNLYYVGLKLTSATFTSATVNILPAVTFIMALVFRLETVNFKKIRSIAKVAGTMVTIGGAMVMTLYKGPVVEIFHAHGHHAAQQTSSESADQHWVLGTLMLLGSIVGWSGFFILQSFTLKKYPAELSLTALICIAGTVEGSIVTLIMERDFSVWVIGWDSRLLAAVYTGVICSGLAYYIQGVVIRQRGPVFVTSFTPLCMIITAFLGFVILAEQIHLGSIIGAFFIVMGLYLVVWGKAKDHLNKLTSQKGAAATELPLTAVPETAEPATNERFPSKAPPA
ncbi:WAT1-related protein At4g08300-like [Cucurbita pepo subsp. pepo]|uniref:WAT1-related protein At4g08300-like n=1 Tax=Cucurbita pepo subsp. pepo TaxID=3664 RepID=UPI000C9D9675|nr:WAT1-related protein At4g08300-like [Cucurbita pepo subsp. pepo]